MDESGAGYSICVVASWQSTCMPLPDGDGRTRSLSIWNKMRPKHEGFSFESQDGLQTF